MQGVQVLCLVKELYSTCCNKDGRFHVLQLSTAKQISVFKKQINNTSGLCPVIPRLHAPHFLISTALGSEEKHLEN